MAENLAEVVSLPVDQGLVLSLGGDDPRRTREIVLAMYAFLINKPLNTRRTYRTGIRQFLDLTSWKDVRSVTLADAAQYKRWLVQRGYSNSTVCTRLAAITSFFTFLTRPVGDDGNQLLTRNPFAFIDRKDVAPTPFAHAEPIAWLDFDKMLKATPTDPIGLRDRAVLIFLAYTGRRRSEVAKLTVGDLNTSTTPRSYKVVTKGNKEQSWELPDLVYEYIRAHWISSGRLTKLRPDSGVFGPVKVCPLTANLDPERPLHNDVIAKIVKRAAKRAGLDASKVKVHGLRHMAARDLDAAGARLQDIQHFLGHSWPNTTSRYLGQLRGPAKSMFKELHEVRQAAVRVAAPIVT